MDAGQRPRARERWHRAGLLIAISLIVAGGVLGGFVVGRRTTRDAFIDKVTRQAALERPSLIAAGLEPLSLLQLIGKRIDDPLLSQALATMYGVPAGDRGALVKRLGEIVAMPPYRPAPFVGHIARPVLGDPLVINVLGFRDPRRSYATKPAATVRVFVTGGSTAWGVGSSSQSHTVSYLLERILNEGVSQASGYRYEVINAAFPAWSTTQEKLLIQQRLTDLHPDLIIMLSGTNDVHWALQGRDVRWLYSYMDQNYVMLLNETYKSSGHPEWVVPVPFSSGPVDCALVGRTAARNVGEAAFAANGAGASLVFALQPNVVSTTKVLSAHERRIRDSQDAGSWNSCYQQMREALGRVGAKHYRLLDLSRSFRELGGHTELFMDPYHFADLGHRLVAQALADQIDWRSLAPGPAVTPDPSRALDIVRIEPVAWDAGKPFNEQPDGTSALRIVTSRMNQNLLVVFDRSFLLTVVGRDGLTASVPRSLYARKGEHALYVVDAVVGQASRPVTFHSR